MEQFYIKTFGCQMNEYDSSKMEALLCGEGFCRTDSPAKADLIVINTCSVREKSYQKAISAIGRLAKRVSEYLPERTCSGRQNGANDPIPELTDGGFGGRAGSPPAIIAVTGCVASQEGDYLLHRFPFVDLAVGPDQIASLPRLVREAREEGRRIVRTEFQKFSDYEFPTPIFTEGLRKGATAYVTIMKGCNNRCSFCIVPRVRGREVSRPPAEIVDEISRLAAEGVREVTLLGQNVNSYGGKDLSEKAGFARLLRLIDEQTSIRRIRYTSPHPKDLSPGLAREHGTNGKLCPHIHLPVQAGSNRILKAMRRSYTREVYLRKVEMVRRMRPDIAITTDLMVGFPGETEDDFQETLSLIEEVGFDAAYSFAFSPRPGTEASRLADDVPSEVKKERLARLQAVQDSLSLARNRREIGRIEAVLVEGPSREGGGQFTGRTPHGRIVNFVGDRDRTGDILDVEIEGASPHSLKGKLCSSK